MTVEKGNLIDITARRTASIAYSAAPLIERVPERTLTACPAAAFVPLVRSNPVAVRNIGNPHDTSISVPENPISLIGTGIGVN